MPATKSNKQIAAINTAHNRFYDQLDEKFDEAVDYFDSIWDQQLGEAPKEFAVNVMRHLVRFYYNLLCFDFV